MNLCLVRMNAQDIHPGILRDSILDPESSEITIQIPGVPCYIYSVSWSCSCSFLSSHPSDKWPRTIRANGHLLLNSEKVGLNFQILHAL